MINRSLVVRITAVLCLAVCVWRWPGSAPGAEESAPPAPAREGLELTIYTQGFGLVREIRPLHLEQGLHPLPVSDISRRLNPQTLLLHWQGDPTGLPPFIPHTFEPGDSGWANRYDSDPLSRFLGQEVELIRYSASGEEAQRLKGRLVTGVYGLSLQVGSQLLLNPQGTIALTPGREIFTTPRLTLRIESPEPRAARLEMHYLTGGLSWSADYQAVLAPQGQAMALEWWATVMNLTGVDYPAAKVTLIAGNIHLTEASDAYRMRAMGGMMAGAGMPGQSPEAVGDLYAYPIPQPMALLQEQMIRLPMHSSARVAVTKEYSASLPLLSAGDSPYDLDAAGPSGRGPVQVHLLFANSRKEGLGSPLPEGVIRVYEPDAAGSLRFVGEASLPGTPADRNIRVTLANAFDLSTEWRLVKQEKVGPALLRKQIELTLSNQKAAPTAIRVMQAFRGQWKIAAESQKHTRPDATQTQWLLKVPARGKAVLTYTADLSG